MHKESPSFSLCRGIWVSVAACVLFGFSHSCKKRTHNSNSSLDTSGSQSAPRTDSDATLFSCELGKINFSLSYRDGTYEVNGAAVSLVGVSAWKSDDASQINYRVTTLDSGEFVLHIHPGSVADEVEKVGVSTPCSRDGAANTERLDLIVEKFKPVKQKEAP